MNIYISGLSYGTNDADLTNLFAEFGEVSSAKVIFDRETGRSRGFAFVEMPNDTEGQKAIDELNGVEYDQKVISVSVARPRTERPYGVCPEVPFPWYDVGNVECHGKFPVCRPQLYLGVVQLGAVNAEDVHVFAIVACLDYNVVESVYLLVIIGESYGTFLLQCNIHEMEELVHGFGK